jgi:hypothetical protein
MDVREDTPIAFDEHGMSRHAHVQFEIASRLMVFVFHSKRERLQLARGDRFTFLLPDDAALPCVIFGPPAVVTSQGTAGNTTRFKLSRCRFRDPGLMNDVGEQLIRPGRERWETLHKGSRPSIVRVQVPKSIERRRDQKQVHRVAVVGHEIVEASGPNPAGIL